MEKNREMFKRIYRVRSTCSKYIVNSFILLFIVHVVASVIESDVSPGIGDTTASLRLTRQKVLIQAIPKSKKLGETKESRKRQSILSRDEYAPPDIIVEQFRIRAKINFQARPTVCKHLLGNTSNRTKFPSEWSSSGERSINCNGKSASPINQTVLGVKSLPKTKLDRSDLSVTTNRPGFLSKITTELSNRNIIFDDNEELIENGLSRRRDIVRTEPKRMKWRSSSLTIPYNLTKKKVQSSNVTRNKKNKLNDIRSNDRIEKLPKIVYKKSLPFFHRSNIAQTRNNEIAKPEPLFVNNELKKVKLHNLYVRDGPIVQPCNRKSMENCVKNNFSGRLRSKDKKENADIVAMVITTRRSDNNNNSEFNLNRKNKLAKMNNLTDDTEFHRADKRSLYDSDSNGNEKTIMINHSSGNSSEKKTIEIIRKTRETKKLNVELDKRSNDTTLKHLITPLLETYGKLIKTLLKKSFEIPRMKKKNPLTHSNEDAPKKSPSNLDEPKNLSNPTDNSDRNYSNDGTNDSIENSTSSLRTTTIVDPVNGNSVSMVELTNSNIRKSESITKILSNYTVDRGNRTIETLSTSPRIDNETHETTNCTNAVVIDGFNNCSVINESSDVNSTLQTMVKRYSRNDTFYENPSLTNKLVVNVTINNDTKNNQSKNRLTDLDRSTNAKGLKKSQVGLGNNRGRKRSRYKGKNQEHSFIRNSVGRFGKEGWTKNNKGASVIRISSSVPPSTPLLTFTTVVNSPLFNSSLISSDGTTAGTAAPSSFDIESIKISTIPSILVNRPYPIKNFNGLDADDDDTERVTNSETSIESIDYSTLSYDPTTIETTDYSTIIPAEYREKIESIKNNRITETSNVSEEFSTFAYDQSSVTGRVIDESLKNKVNGVVLVPLHSVPGTAKKEQLLINLNDPMRSNDSTDSSDDTIKKVYFEMENNQGKNEEITVSSDWENRENSTFVETVNGASTTYGLLAIKNKTFEELKGVRKVREIENVGLEYEEPTDFYYDIGNVGVGDEMVDGSVRNHQQLRTDEGFEGTGMKKNIRFPIDENPHAAVHGVFFKDNRLGQHSESTVVVPQIYQTRDKEFFPVSMVIDNYNGISDNSKNSSIDEPELATFVKSLEQFIFDDSASGTFNRMKLLPRESSNGNFQTRSAIFKTKRLTVVDNNFIDKTDGTKYVGQSLANKSTTTINRLDRRIRGNIVGVTKNGRKTKIDRKNAKK